MYQLRLKFSEMSQCKSKFIKTIYCIDKHNNLLMSFESISFKTLKHDINLLLALYNEVDKEQKGVISAKSIKIILSLIQLDVGLYQSYLHENQVYEFDALLSILGHVEVVEQPSIYVLSFLKILSNYRKRCIDNGSEEGLKDARAIDKKIQKICGRELQREINKIQKLHKKIYEQMEKSQQKQYSSFEAEWNEYLRQFQYQNHQTFKRNQLEKNNKIIIQSLKIEALAKKNIIMTSPKLRELNDKKKWLIKDGRYDKAIEVNSQITDESRRVSSFYQQKINQSVSKKLKSMQKKNQQTLQFLETNSNINLNKLLMKKKQGQNIMRIRMKNLRDEAQKKLKDHLRSEINRLRSALHNAAKS